MALIKCPECGKEISDQAVSCPNCGRPMINNISQDGGNEDSKKKKRGFIIVAGIALLIIVGALATLLWVKLVREKKTWGMIPAVIESAEVKEVYDTMNNKAAQEIALVQAAKVKEEVTVPEYYYQIYDLDTAVKSYQDVGAQVNVNDDKSVNITMYSVAQQALLSSVKQEMIDEANALVSAENSHLVKIEISDNVDNCDIYLKTTEIEKPELEPAIKLILKCAYYQVLAGHPEKEFDVALNVFLADGETPFYSSTFGETKEAYEAEQKEKANRQAQKKAEAAAAAAKQKPYEEVIAYEHDLAERDVINRFTSADIVVDFPEYNNDTDIDGIIDGPVTEVYGGE